ncbi:MAG: DUF5615 family PIN-like protein [Leptospiraceae bacterium]|nr:DUF5615 family PIN-like protein [Leptospiraceae bacterium]
MELKRYSFLSDENIHPDVVKYLRNQNIEIKDVKESGLSGKSDSYLLNLAFKENRIILTHDSDFGRLAILENAKFVGIIFLRPGHFFSDLTITTLEVLLNTNFKELQIPFIIVGENTGNSIKVRLRNS